jgi:hypothetical protein
MKGFTVITSDEKKAGHVVEEQGEYLIVEHGALRKHRSPLPRAFAHVDEAEQIVRATVPSGVLHEAPELGDDHAIARHYGLEWDEPEAPTDDEADMVPAERADDSSAADRAVARERMQPGEGPNDSGSSIGITGGDRFRDAKRP